MLFTSAPPIAIGLFDQNCKAETRMNIPELYISSQKSDSFNNKVFWRWIMLAVIHSMVLYFVPMGVFKYGVVWSNGKTGDYLVIGNIVYTCVILTVSVKALLILDSWNSMTSLSIFGSIALWFLFLVVYSYFWVMGLPLAANMAGIIELIGISPMFWFCMLLVPFLALLPDICGKVGMLTIQPSQADLVKLAEKGNFSPKPYMDGLGGRLNKLKQETKNLIDKTKKKKSKSPELPLADRQHRNSGRGYGHAFSQEEGGCMSQTELVKTYEQKSTSSASGSRYDQHPTLAKPSETSSNTNNDFALGM